MSAGRFILLAALALSCSVRAEPSGGNRALLVHPDEFTDKWIERAKGLGVKTLSIHPEGGGAAVDSLTNLLAMCRTEEFRRRVDRATAAGVQVEYELHAGSWLVPRSLFGSHPEYFIMGTNGVRTSIGNFCVSNPEALKIASRRACELARGLYGSSHRHYFWLDDRTDVFCRCSDCSRLTPSDQQLVALNAMVCALRADDPEAELAYLAYHDTMPVPTEVRPAEGIFLEYAPISRPQDRSLVELKDDRMEVAVRRLLDWFGRKDSRVLEYWYDNSLRSRWKKPERRFVPYSEVVRSDIVWYVRKGFEEIASFACFLGPEYEDAWGEPDLSAFGSTPEIAFRAFYGEGGGRDRTAFRCFREGSHVRFSFNVWDDTVCAAPSGNRKRNLEAFDRVEVFFSPTAELTNDVCCIEIDPLGRVLDYKMRTGHPFDFSWRAQTLTVSARVVEGGYVVDGSIAVRELEDEGLDLSGFHIGAFRADYATGNRLVEWYSSRRPDGRPAFFHQPNMFLPACLAR